MFSACRINVSNYFSFHSGPDNYHEFLKIVLLSMWNRICPQMKQNPHLWCARFRSWVSASSVSLLPGSCDEAVPHFWSLHSLSRRWLYVRAGTSAGRLIRGSWPFYHEAALSPLTFKNVTTRKPWVTEVWSGLNRLP